MTKQTIEVTVDKVDYVTNYIPYDTVIAKIISTMDDYASKQKTSNSITSEFFALKSHIVALAEQLALATEVFEFEDTHTLQEYNGAAFIRIVPMARAPGHLLFIKDRNANTDYIIDMAEIVKQLATKKED